MALQRRMQIESLEVRNLLANDLIISEFMASNADTIKDSFGEFSDWIELHNQSEQEIDLSGWQLTDNPQRTTIWTFSESIVIPTQGRMVVWASDRGLITDTGEVHANFKLKSGGEYLGLINPGGQVVSQFGDLNSDYPSLPTDVSFGIDTSGLQRHYLYPTPGLPNDDQSGGLVADTRFSVDRGFYTEPFSVTIRSSTDHATLAYTLDGSVPSPTNGVQVVGDENGPLVTLVVDSTTTLRAVAYLDGWTSTNVDTQTYLFPEQIIRQSNDGLPGSWGHAGPDYEMDPEIVDAPQYRDLIVDSLLSIPTVSLVSDMDNFFATGGVGIYPQGQNSARPVSMEMLFPETKDDLQVEASVEIAGGSSTNRWKSDKLSMQLKFKGELGDPKLVYPLFGDGATTKFDTLLLDARLNQAWHYGGGSSPTSQRLRAQFTRDQYVANLQRELGGFSPHGQWVHLYLNGIYWGMHNLHERPDEHFAQDYLGGEKADYDIIKHNDDVVNGSFTAYQALLNAASQNMQLEARYRAVEGMLDVDDFISYMLVNYYVGNTDWGHQNWYASYNAESGDGKWRYHSWDAEHVLKEVGDDPTGRGDELGPTRLHHRLMKNPEYALKFMDTVQATMFNDGKLTPTQTIAMYEDSLDQVRDALVAESARWGDNQRDVPYTRDNEWKDESERLLNDYFPARTDLAVQLFRNRGFFHDYDAPAFHQHGGEVEPGFEASISSSGGTVFYTVDGSDPMDSATAVEYTQAIPIRNTTTLRTRALRGENEWSAVTVATFEVPLPGDFSNNGKIDAADIDVLLAAIAAGNSDEKFDLDDSGAADSADVDYWLVEIADSRRGDTDLDGDVDFADFLVLSSNFGSTDVGWSDGNFDSENDIGFADFLALSAQFGWKRDV